jgi:Ni/Co efflux regulator RcnB
MRKFILLAALAAIALPSAANAERPRHERHRDRVEVRHDRHEVRRDRREIRRDRNHHRVREAHRDRRELRSDRRELHRDRRDLRHDRRHYRHHHAYVAPFRGWRYRPVTIGFRLNRAFFAPRYYISDYGYYGLRAPGRWNRWIRYGNDLLLVNVRTGRVLQVIHYRYW